MGDVIDLGRPHGSPCASCGEEDFIGATFTLTIPASVDGSRPGVERREVMICMACLLEKSLECQDASLALIRDLEEKCRKAGIPLE